MILNRSTASLAKETSEERKATVDQINTMIGEARRSFFTDIPGQDMVYREKEREAIAYLATNPDPEDTSPVSEVLYPFMYEECSSVGYTAWQASQLFLNRAVQVRALSVKLEGLRGSYNEQATSAATSQELLTLTQDLKTTLRAFLASQGV